MSADLDELAESMALIARPGIAVSADDDGLVIRLLNRSDPSIELVVFGATPLDVEWGSRFAELIRSFDEFNDVAAAMVERATELDVAMVVAQEIYNRAIVLNSHHWDEVFEFEFRHIEHDMTRWS